MQLRHATALALVAWYLMMPPLRPDGSANIGAPLSKWTMVSSFDTARECTKVMMISQGYLADPRTMKKLELTRNPRLLNEACISSDDPLLKEE